MSQIVVRPNGPLEGTLQVGGAKNSALKLMAASLLAEGEYHLRNVPSITDVDTMAELLVCMGVAVTRPAPHEVILRRGADCGYEAPYELVERMRASIVVLGPLLGRMGRARVAMPGGDDFGSRPIDMHLSGLEQMGATFEVRHGYIEATADQLMGARIVLEFPSVGATENLLLAAVLAKGTTIIENAAREPEIADLAAFLNRMGALIVGAGTSTIEVEGVEELEPADHTVIPDRIEAATYLAALALAGGEITIEGARHDHMDMFIRKLGDMGMRIAPSSSGLWAFANRRLTSVDVSTLPYPGIATDYKPLFVTMLSVAEGIAIVTENLFAGRFRYVSELIRMGADIRTEGRHAVVRGVGRLSGAPVRASDIRAGAALVVAGLAAEGETVVADAEHIDRGYEDLPGRLRSLGAKVFRSDDASDAGEAVADADAVTEVDNGG
ncbi:MAG: UDP-N-acetylglucosamine 1-carboxyvinyltransferase [Acidimicrobiaceae bacterium]|nr:UDP-N-acetylglucosamine 1-carboxyvinyltransferase [Acidimicrobiaceae bacterium]MDQ1412318.1 UDP-N-acetylglucosamine 1-carboxyvinyltransferase [Acidimicrobiaceae bacterium]